jgi:hypothetical protein
MRISNLLESNKVIHVKIFTYLEFITKYSLNDWDKLECIKTYVENGNIYKLYLSRDLGYVSIDQEEMAIMCSVCGTDFPEGDVNIVDYEDDVCIHCESTYCQPE